MSAQDIVLEQLMVKSSTALAALVGVACLFLVAPAQAQTVMQQCGQQYQAAKAAGTLNGMSWNQFRGDCSARMKGTPAATTAPATPPTEANPLKPATPVVAPPAPPAAAPPTPVAPTVAVGKPAVPATGGRAAMLTRERQCGAEWRTQKVSLVAQTPGLTWPKYWSLCNTRLKAAGQ